jgi:gliding motility associated protien GldN
MKVTMKTLAKISGVSFLILFGWESSIAQANNSNTNTNNQTNVSQPQPNPPGTGQSQPSVLSPNQPLDGAYKPDDKFDRRVVPPAMMREADIMWQTRVWRVIDTREKINQQLYYPEKDNGNRHSLFEILKDALLGGEISGYSFNPFDWDDCESIRLTKTELVEQLNPIDTVTDENGNTKAVPNPVTADKIKGYLIKEDWHFEKQRSVIDPRILWICPRIATINKNTNTEDLTAAPTSLFWINFQEIRPILAKTPVFNQENDAEWRTFDDIFWKRQFNSYIVQQSNVFNRSIPAYMKGYDALLQGEKVHDKIFEIEHDMWQY